MAIILWKDLLREARHRITRAIELRRWGRDPEADGQANDAVKLLEINREGFAASIDNQTGKITKYDPQFDSLPKSEKTAKKELKKLLKKR